MKVTLQGGIIAPDVHAEGNSTNANEKRARICYEGEFDSINGPVVVTAEDLKRIADAHNGRLARMGMDVRMADCPPVQLDHSQSALHTVGRVVGPLEIGDWEGLTALFGTLRFLGQENIEKANDGRWTHLSIGADLESGDLFEVTVTPFPAAKNAAMLARLGGGMNEAEMRKYLMDSEGISEDDAKTKLGAMTDEEKEELCNKMKSAKLAEDEDKGKDQLSDDENKDKDQLGDSKITIEHDADGDGEVNMSDDEDEDETELSEGEDEDDEEKEKAELSAKLSAYRGRASALKTKMARANLGNKIMQLKAKGKITPAEIRKMDLDKLCGENEATIKAVLKTYEDRQPVIMAGQYGSVEAIDRERLIKEASHHQLREETLANMPFTAAALGHTQKNKATTLSATMDENTVAQSPTRPVDADTQMRDADGMWDEIVRAIGEGRHDEAKASFMKACRMGAADVGTTPEDMSELMAAVVDLENDFGAVVQLAGSKLGIKL